MPRDEARSAGRRFASSGDSGSTRARASVRGGQPGGPGPGHGSLCSFSSCHRRVERARDDWLPRPAAREACGSGLTGGVLARKIGGLLTLPTAVLLPSYGTMMMIKKRSRGSEEPVGSNRPIGLVQQTPNLPPRPSRPRCMGDHGACVLAPTTRRRRYDLPPRRVA